MFKEQGMKLTIVTIKWGTRYGADYVNTLRSMTAKYGLADAQFVCFTDDSSGITHEISCYPLPEIVLPETVTWTFWRKLCLFQTTLPISGPCLYLDLDIVITGNLQPLLDNWNGCPRFIKNWVGKKTARRDRYDRINSSVVLFTAGTCSRVLEMFYAAPDKIIQEYPGDQGFVYDCLAENCDFFREGLCVSFKKHCIPKFPLNFFLTPKPPKGTSVVLFHGKPDPNEAAVGWSQGRLKKRCRPVPWVAH